MSKCINCKEDCLEQINGSCVDPLVTSKCLDITEDNNLTEVLTKIVENISCEESTKTTTSNESNSIDTKCLSAYSTCFLNYDSSLSYTIKNNKLKFNYSLTPMDELFMVDNNNNYFKGKELDLSKVKFPVVISLSRVHDCNGELIKINHTVNLNYCTEGTYSNKGEKVSLSNNKDIENIEQVLIDEICLLKEDTKEILVTPKYCTGEYKPFDKPILSEGTKVLISQLTEENSSRIASLECKNPLLEEIDLSCNNCLSEKYGIRKFTYKEAITELSECCCKIDSLETELQELKDLFEEYKLDDCQNNNTAKIKQALTLILINLRFIDSSIPNLDISGLNANFETLINSIDLCTD